MKIKSIIAIAAALTLVSCSSEPTQKVTKTVVAIDPAGAQGASGVPAIRQFPMHGKILSVDAAAKKARIDAGQIGDWMGPMTMNYLIKDDAAFATLKEGNEIDCTVNVTPDDDFWVTGIKIVK